MRNDRIRYWVSNSLRQQYLLADPMINAPEWGKQMGLRAEFERALNRGFAMEQIIEALWTS